MPLSGEIVFQRVFDLGGTLDMRKARELLGPMAESGAVPTSYAAPTYVSFAAPIPLNLSSLNLDLSVEGGAPLAVSARLYEVGVLAVLLRVGVRGERLAELARFQDLGLLEHGRPVARQKVFQDIRDALRPRLKPALDEIFDVPVEPEAYTAYCLTEVPGGAEYAFREERALIAGLLTGEAHHDRLAPAQADEVLRTWTSYFRDDLAVVDWDAAFVVEPSGQYEDFLYLFEVANLQLLVIRKYDHYLDAVLERSYAEYGRLFKGPPFSTRRAREMVQELGEVRVDLAKATDEMANTAKFFGDWYLGRVYLGAEAKFHIRDYQRLLDEKLTTLNELYQSVLHEIDRRQNLALEILIFLLILFEVVVAFVRH